jgi:SMI1 / KNR4 family (SUKH-1)
MEKLLKNLSIFSIKLDEKEFSAAQKKAKWLGFPPANEDAIIATETRLNCTFPTDYKEFLKLSNGFEQTSGVHGSFLPIEKVDFWIKLDEDAINAWGDGNPQLAEQLRKGILIGGWKEDQQILLMPPQKPTGKWACWKVAPYIPGESIFKSLTELLKADLAFLKQQIKYKKEHLATPKMVADHSLRDALKVFDWETVYTTAILWIKNDVEMPYQTRDFSELLALAQLSAYKLGTPERYNGFLDNLALGTPEKPKHTDYQVGLHKVSTQKKEAFVPDLQELNRFKPQQNPQGLAEIEIQIQKHRKDLLKWENNLDKVGYQFHFLFEYGNAAELIRFYEAPENAPFYMDALKAARVYAHVGENAKAKKCIEKYWSFDWDSRPFEPFLDEVLLPILEKH